VNPDLNLVTLSGHVTESVGGGLYGLTMVCLVCSSYGRELLCRRCRDGLVPGGRRRISGGLLVGSGLIHNGPARILVHRLKYQGIRQAGGVLAEGMAEAMPGMKGTLVPVRRVLLRTWKYGVDPGWELAAALASITGCELKGLLRPPLWAPVRAGKGREMREAIWFRARPAPAGPLILVDDVLTTGATLQAARQAAGESAIYGVTATSAGRVVV
jgi:predicted amidophosphoribosyltransferase